MKKAIVILLACSLVLGLFWCATSVRIWSAGWTHIDDATILTSDTAVYVFVEASDSERRLTLLQYIGAYFGVDPGQRTVESSYRLEVFSYREPVGVRRLSVALPGYGIGPVMPLAPSVVWFRRDENDYIAWDGAELKIVAESASRSILERIRKIGDTEALQEAGWNVIDISPLERPGPNKFAAIDAAPNGVPVHIEMRADPTDPSSKTPQRGLRSITVWMKGEKVFEVRESGM